MILREDGSPGGGISLTGFEGASMAGHKKRLVVGSNMELNGFMCHYPVTTIIFKSIDHIYSSSIKGGGMEKFGIRIPSANQEILDLSLQNSYSFLRMRL